MHLHALNLVFKSGFHGNSSPQQKRKSKQKRHDVHTLTLRHDVHTPTLIHDLHTQTLRHDVHTQILRHDVHTQTLRHALFIKKNPLSLSFVLRAHWACTTQVTPSWRGRWCLQTDPWWAVDLGQVYEVTDVEITNRGDCCGRLTVTVLFIEIRPLLGFSDIWRAGFCDE